MDDIDSKRFEVMVDALRAAEPEKVMYTLGEARQFIATKAPRDIENAALQSLQRGTFPFRTVRVGGRRMVSLPDLAAGLIGLDSPPADAQKGRVGRPRLSAARAVWEVS